MIERTIFYAAGLVDVRELAALVWSAEVEGRSGSISIDLNGATPQTASTWSKVEYDDNRVLYGASQIPHEQNGKYGVMYSATRYLHPPFGYNGHGPGPGPWPDYGKEGRVYEFVVVKYSNSNDNGPLKGMRYYGFHAEWKGVSTDRRNATILPYHAGRSLEGVSPGSKPIDLTSLDVVHPDDPELGRQLEGGREGRLFLSCATANMFGLTIPKLPAILADGYPVDNCEHRARQ